MGFVNKNLFEEIDRFEKLMATLAAQLAQAAEEVRQVGQIPVPGLGEQVMVIQQCFSNLRDLFNFFLFRTEWPIPTAYAEIRTLSQLRQLGQHLNDAWGRPPTVQDVLLPVKRLIHRDESDFTPLEECRDRVDRLITALAGPSAASEDLPAALLPFAHLQLLVEKGSQMTEPQRRSIETCVGQQFGELLAQAAAAGRLTYVPDANSALTNPSPLAAAPSPVARHPRVEISSEVTRILRTNKDLPAFPATAYQLMSLTNQPNTTIKNLADVVEADPGLTAKYLRLANSAAYGGNANTVAEALFRIGFLEIRRIALSVTVIDAFKFLREKADWDHFWFHSILAARLTENLCDAYQPAAGHEYIAGLLHDIGKLFLGRFFSNEFGDVIASAQAEGLSLYDAEKKYLDITHAEIGAALCEKWRLGADITQAVRYHHRPQVLLEKTDLPIEQVLLTICIRVVDAAANLCASNLRGSAPVEVDFEDSPDWRLLDNFTPRRSLDLDIAAEIQRTQETIDCFVTDSAAPSGE